MSSRTDELADKASEVAATAANKAGDTAGKVADAAGAVTEKLADKAGEVAEKMADTASGVASKVAELASNAAHAATPLVEKAADSLSQSAEKLNKRALKASKKAGKQAKSTVKSAAQSAGANVEKAQAAAGDQAAALTRKARGQAAKAAAVVAAKAAATAAQAEKKARKAEKAAGKTAAKAGRKRHPVRTVLIVGVVAGGAAAVAKRLKGGQTTPPETYEAPKRPAAPPDVAGNGGTPAPKAEAPDTAAEAAETFLAAGVADAPTEATPDLGSGSQESDTTAESTDAADATDDKASAEDHTADDGATGPDRRERRRDRGAPLRSRFARPARRRRAAPRVRHQGQRELDALPRAQQPRLWPDDRRGLVRQRRIGRGRRVRQAEDGRQEGRRGVVVTIAPEGRKMLRLEVRNAAVPIEKKPDWIKTRLRTGPEFTSLQQLVKREGLHTVCQEAGCPNIYECWEDREATFLIGGDQCTRRCDFCLIDTGKPGELDRDEPRRVAESIATMDLRYATITGVTRDDLPDEGAWLYAETIRKVHELAPTTGVEILTPDFSGKPDLLQQVFDAAPEVFAHNVETVPRIFRRIRPAFTYERSLDVISRPGTPGW